jgi:glutamyl-tRNA(Gln) amidotransferase subunit E
MQNVTDLFRQTKSGILKKAKRIEAITLTGFAGLVGREIQPERRLGSELSDYAKVCGVGGIFHTDEKLAAYGITGEEVTHLRQHMNAGDADCIVLVAGMSQKQTGCAIFQVFNRAKISISQNPVPEETRKMLESGSTAYMRPLPGAARMYPETDVLPVIIDDARWSALAVPELLAAKTERYSRTYEIEPNYAAQLASSEKIPLFERAVREGIKPKLAAFSILSTITELRREGVQVQNIPDDAYLGIWNAVEKGRAAKEAIPDLLRSVASGTTLDDAIAQLAPAVSREELEGIVKKIIADRSDFVRQKQKAALGPLMGVVMAEVRGSVDGKVVSEILRKEIDRVLAGKSR